MLARHLPLPRRAAQERKAWNAFRWDCSRARHTKTEEKRRKRETTCTRAQLASRRLPALPKTVARRSDRIGAYTGFAARQRVTGTIQTFVVCVMILAKCAERLFTGPAIDGQVAAGNVGVAQQFRALIVRRGTEEVRPCPVRPIGRFERGNLLLSNLELPHHNEHCEPQSFPNGSAGAAPVPTVDYSHERMLDTVRIKPFDYGYKLWL